MKLKEIERLIELLDEKGLAEIEIKSPLFKIRISKYPSAVVPPASPQPQPLVVSQQPPVEQPVETPPETEKEIPKVEEPPKDENLHEIKSPIVGTFYRAPAPGEAPFVEVGDHVKPGDVLCIVEAMKVMNQIKSDVAGTVVEILVENGKPVEYGQVLFRIRPD